MGPLQRKKYLPESRIENSERMNGLPVMIHKQNLLDFLLFCLIVFLIQDSRREWSSDPRHGPPNSVCAGAW